tara:strand:+ start:646 stop:933 length:288 start_codon:yes stop_codon:yes gene_type:complete
LNYAKVKIQPPRKQLLLKSPNEISDTLKQIYDSYGARAIPSSTRVQNYDHDNSFEYEETIHRNNLIIDDLSIDPKSSEVTSEIKIPPFKAKRYSM